MAENYTVLDGLTFDDVFIRPGRASFSPLDVSLESEVVRGFQSSLPLIAAPMSTVFSLRLAAALAARKVLAPLPREISEADLEETLDVFPKIPIIATASPFRTAGIKKLLANSKIDYLILDSVAAYNDKVFELLDSLDTELIRRIIVGNIVTAEAAFEFSRYELAGLKVGLGPGSICTTTQVTGVGVPQLQAICEVYRALSGTGIPIIADGGIRSPGDIAKAIAAGASGVMLGKLFAATTEGGGQLVSIHGTQYKRYDAAEYSTIEGHNRHYAESTFENSGFTHRTEGVSGLVRLSGPAAALLSHIARCLSASIAFTGSANLEQFRRNAVFQKVSAAAQRSANFHSIDIVMRKDRLTGVEGYDDVATPE